MKVEIAIFVALLCTCILEVTASREVIQTAEVHVGVDEMLERTINEQRRVEGVRNEKLNKKLMENPNYRQLLMELREGLRDLSDREVSEMLEDLEDLLPANFFGK